MRYSSASMNLNVNAAHSAQPQLRRPCPHLHQRRRHVPQHPAQRQLQPQPPLCRRTRATLA
jgi:hypothetical protein